MADSAGTPGTVPEIPWADESTWSEANASIRRAIEINGPALSRVKIHSRQIRLLLESTADLIQDLCLNTCPHCPEPCCSHAKVWLDFRDLLLLYLEGISVPPTQLRWGMEGPCLFLGSRGCVLDRLSRPFVCFWYFCPAQTLRLSKMPPQTQKSLDNAVSAIKFHRSAMEAAFIQALVK